MAFTRIVLFCNALLRRAWFLVSFHAALQMEKKFYPSLPSSSCRRSCFCCRRMAPPHMRPALWCVLFIALCISHRLTSSDVLQEHGRCETSSFASKVLPCFAFVPISRICLPCIIFESRTIMYPWRSQRCRFWSGSSNLFVLAISLRCTLLMFFETFLFSPARQSLSFLCYLGLYIGLAPQIVMPSCFCSHVLPPACSKLNWANLLRRTCFIERGDGDANLRSRFCCLTALGPKSHRISIPAHSGFLRFCFCFCFSLQPFVSVRSLEKVCAT